MISKDLEKNRRILRKKLKSDDVIFLDVAPAKVKALLIFAEDLCDKDLIGQQIVRPITEMQTLPKNVTENILCPEKEELTDYDKICEQVVIGNAVLIFDKVSTAFSFGLKKFDKRAITEPPTSTVLKGPREGFVENLSVNISLIRRKLKTPALTFENVTVGSLSKTPVSVCYVKGIAEEKLVKCVKEKLKNIKTDAILDSSYISKFLGEHRSSVFKQLGNTEKPDILSAKILEGRVAILVDGSPIALTVPYLLIEDFQSPSDYYSSVYTAILSRNLRLFSVLISILLPAFFLSAELFHLQLIPLSFLLTIVNSIKGIPLSPSSEMFFTLIIFEILNEASVRMPKYVGMVVSIVGGLVLGETAVNAGIISAPTLMVVAFSGICLYTVPELEQTFSIIRIVLLVVGGFIGSYGIITAMLFMLVYLVSFENYNTPLLAPFSPLITKDLKDTFYKENLLRLRRPLSLSHTDRIKVPKSNQKGEK